MILYAATVFLSAFLLFLVQPILAKYILPWFGGSPGVWTTCLLFFQILLTAGYGLSHLLVKKLIPRRQALFVLALLVLTLAALPITPSKAYLPEVLSAPTWYIIKLLSASVGIGYFLLSSISPLMQSWLSQSRVESSPYRLYTLSNLGSLLAIVGYPLLIEPNFGLGFQTLMWSALYWVLAILIGLCALRQWKTQGSLPGVLRSEAQDVNTNPMHSPSLADRLMWLGASALTATLLMATTNQLCQDAAVIPLLWLLPMGLYLLTYIICFQSDRWYSRAGFGIALVIALGQTCWILDKGIYVELPLQILSYSFTLFICCMIGHGELVRLKPAPRHLTSFYLMMSAGGALGGIFVSLIAPHVFRGYWEFHIGLVGTALFFLIVLLRDRAGRLYSGRPRWAWALLCLAMAVLMAALSSQIRGILNNAVTMKRNFFGTLKIIDADPMNPLEHRIVMMHGRIEHGYQYRVTDKRYWPTSYFGAYSGAGIAIRFHPRRLNPAQRHLRIGIVGLGTGTMAAYGEEGDYLRFYEINPDVIEFSERYFSYRKDTSAKIDIVPGDARISIEREISQRQPGDFDVFAVDAFSSDAIPIHLLTRECYLKYWHHLKKDGILALHISSRYFNLSPVIRSLAAMDEGRGMKAFLIEDPGSSLQETDPTRWILITANQEFMANPDVKRAITPWKEEDRPGPLFTDDYSNLFRLLQ